MAKKNFIMYTDFESTLDLLNDEQAGKLFKALYNYVNGRNEPNFKDGMLVVSFNMLKTQLERDLVKYNNRVKVNAENGKKGGLAKVANASKRKQSVANLADSDSDSERDSVRDSDIKNIYTEKYFVDNELNKLFIEFLKLRKSLKAKNTEKAITLLINKLDKFDNKTRTQMINNSIMNSWKSVFELKGNKKIKEEKVLDISHL